MDDVHLWRANDLPRRFELARQILLRQTSDAMAMLPALLEQREISRSDLQTWPLFDSLRELSEFRLLVAGTLDRDRASGGRSSLD